jgi:hypothetical protein
MQLFACRGWFAHEALQMLQSRFSSAHPDVVEVSLFITKINSALCGKSKLVRGIPTLKPMPSPSSDHLRVGCLVRFHGLSAPALNGRLALVFGPERNGQVAVRLVEASSDVRTSLGWCSGAEKTVNVENLQFCGLPPAAPSNPGA